MQEIYYEHSIHLNFLNENLKLNKLISSNIPEKVKYLVDLNFKSGSRHAPFFLHGPHGSGKSTLISHLYMECENWFPSNVKLHRVIRFAKATPRSAYNLELLRVICQQISIILQIPEGYLPKDASFDPLYIYNWFQTLLKRCEDLNHDVLFIFIDDLHKINPLDCDIVAALSWLPISLPWNVHLICSTSTSVESLKLTPMQKERFKSLEYLYELTENTISISKFNESQSFHAFISKEFDRIEDRFGQKGIEKFSKFLNCTEYGLTETEFLELLMPTHDSDAMLDTFEGNFNFINFCAVRNEMSKFSDILHLKRRHFKI